MLVLYKDEKIYPCKLIACISGSFNEFDGYNLIFQQVDESHNTSLVLFKDYLHFSYLIKNYADTVNGQCFIVQADCDKDIVTLAKDKEKWVEYFTILHNNDD